MRSKIHKGLIREALKHICILTLIFLTLYPFSFLVVSSLKSHEDIIHNMLGLPQVIRWINYIVAWKKVNIYILNSIMMSGATVGMVIFLASYTGFIFARHKFPGREFLFYAIIALLMIPRELTLIPLFIIVRDLGLLNSRWGCIIPWTSGGLVFGIFIMRTFMASLPEEIFESARLDGANETQLYLKIALPLSGPIIIAVGIMHFLNTWNDIIWPLVTITREELKPVTIGLMSFQAVDPYAQNYGPLFAGYLLACIPLIILFMFTMKYYIRGLLAGAIKM